jgi:CubicO group peptidase (beta-lactamase class C family)
MNHQAYQRLMTMAHEKKFNGQILFVERNQRFEYIHGVEDINKQTSLSHQSIFSVASGTKFLTALAIGKLIDENKFTLETKAKDILDLGFEMYDDDIRIKHLLSHTSGIPDYLDESLDEHQEIDNLNLKEVSDYLRYFPRRPMDFKPGTRFQYNNSAFVYLALIIEHITHMSYQDYINHHLLEPLGIFRSGIFLASSSFHHKAWGYVDVRQQKTHIGYIPEMSGGDGGAYMQADDLMHILTSFMDHQILSKPLTLKFITPQVLADEKTEEWYGLGVWLKKKHDQFIPFVIGIDPGIRMKAYFDPIQNLYTWIASNVEEDIWDIFHLFDQVVCA